LEHSDAELIRNAHQIGKDIRGLPGKIFRMRFEYSDCRCEFSYFLKEADDAAPVLRTSWIDFLKHHLPFIEGFGPERQVP